MTRRRIISSVAMLALLAGTAFAQTTGQKPFEPQVGQAGKDVVWVPTPQAVVDTDARHGEGHQDRLRDGPRIR